MKIKIKIISFLLLLSVLSCISIQSIYDDKPMANSKSVNGNDKGKQFADKYDLDPLARRTFLGVKNSKDDWFAFKAKKTKPYFYDFSFLNDGVAGEHGFIKATSKGDLKFEDGTPVKFFGADIVANNCFPDKSVAKKKALIFSKMGVNFVRLHHMDAPWASPSLIDYSKEDTSHFNRNALDKLDYLVFQLEQKGIYIYLDFLVHRAFSLGDGIKAKPLENGAKQSGEFDPDLIALQKEYAKKLLMHYNPYTKKKYIDDSAIVVSEFINESSVFIGFGGYNVAPYYDKELDKFWKEFLKKRNLPLNLKRAKFSFSSGLVDSSVSEKENKLSIMFYHKLTLKYAKEMKEFLRKLGVKYLLTLSNLPLIINADVHVSSLLNYSDFHTYWDHPKVWLINNDWSRLAYAPIDNTPALKGYNNFFADSIKANIKNKPFIVTEYNGCFPNQYRITGIPIMGFYGSLQGFDGLLFFESGSLGEPGSGPGEKLLEPFTLSGRMDAMELFGVVSLIFRRRYLSESQTDLNVNFGRDYIYGHGSFNTFFDQNKFLAFIQKSTVSFDTNLLKTQFPVIDKKNMSSGEIKSDTGELVFNYDKGYVLIDAPKVQGVIGFLKNHTFRLKNFDVTIKNEHGVVLFVSLDDLPLEQSKKILVTVLGKVENSDQEYAQDRKSIVTLGKLPILYERMKGNIVFKNIKGSELEVNPVYWDNQKREPMQIINTKNSAEFKLTGKTETAHFIILRK